jgi:hypothetical protein
MRIENWSPTSLQQRLVKTGGRLVKHARYYWLMLAEAGEDGSYLDAMRKANIKGALVGVEAVTPEGLKAVFKDWNYSGEALAKQLQTIKQHGVHVLSSFIFGLPTDRAATFDATVEMALKAGVTFAQFVMMTPFPGTVDFGRWEKEQSQHPTMVGDVPITRYWMIPIEVRPKMFTPHPTMTSDETCASNRLFNSFAESVPLATANAAMRLSSNSWPFESDASVMPSVNKSNRSPSLNSILKSSYVQSGKTPSTAPACSSIRTAPPDRRIG